MKIVSKDSCAKLGKTKATVNMANPGRVTLIRIEDHPLQLVSIPNCSSLSSLEEDYGSAEDMSTSPDTSCRSSADKRFDLEEDFREKLTKFDDIIEKIENLRFVRNEDNDDDDDEDDEDEENANRNVDRSENNVDNVEYRDELRASRHDNHEDNVNNNDNVTTDDNDDNSLPLNIRGVEERRRLSLDDGNSLDDDSEAEQKHEDSDDSDLIQRGPIKPDFQSVRAGHPYIVSCLSRINNSVDVATHITVDYDKTAEQILRNKDYSDKLNPCLDQLSNSNCRNNQLSNGAMVPDWTGQNGNFHSGDPSGDVALPYRVPQAFSSSSSSNQSYSDVASPLNYQTSLSYQYEEQLNELRSLSGWSYDSSGTIVNSDTNETLQLVEQIIEEERKELKEFKEPQVASNAPSFSSNYNNRRVEPPVRGTLENNPERECPASDARNEKPICPSVLNAIPNNSLMSVYTSKQNTSGGTLVNCTVNGQATSVLDAQRYYETSVKNPQVDVTTTCYGTLYNIALISNNGNMSEQNASREMFRVVSNGEKRYNQAPSTFLPDDFQKPSVPSSFTSNRRQRNLNRGILPWPSLNLPSVRASERLKEGLLPEEVRKAMEVLLKKTVEELAVVDEDGDTALMCLVSDPEELTKKKAYLAPLVERLGNMPDALSRVNNCGVDALYLAAINCPEMPYVSGYLAAAMLQKGININQRLYYGNTLIHCIAARGDSHGKILAELLTLKTLEGNSVFDPSNCNCEGKTALHTAVESHDPTGRGVRSLATTRMLLENGVDLKVKENKCGDTALHLASLSCDPALVKVLLNKASSRIVNETNYMCNTPLHMVAAVSNTVTLEKQKEVCQLLIQAGGQTNIPNRQGKMPLALVSPERKEAIKKIFYKK
ncbi:nf-kappa-b inhibitor zeta [Lasius niger]|uniref:Nf-kappa-b inhibitor zeta n=1 Tax=Lasius niger TaxID=67767 RepID=A0A0J7KQF0_LASNI|nr:nf-kappa-b inhibitor zeta [Lasius niger]